jgi:Rod binding domain-containing protein
MLPINSNSFPPASTLPAATGPATSAKSKPVDSPDQQKLKKAAGDFESILLASMWKSMKQSFKDPNDAGADGADAASGTIEDWGIEVMSGAVGKAGGLGIGNMIIKQLEPATSGQPAAKPAPETNVFGKLADDRL